jgi:hypothetical protein
VRTRALVQLVLPEPGSRASIFVVSSSGGIAVSGIRSVRVRLRGPETFPTAELAVAPAGLGGLELRDRRLRGAAESTVEPAVHLLVSRVLTGFAVERDPDSRCRLLRLLDSEDEFRCR